MTGSSIPLLIIALSIAGAFADWRYKKAGGKPPSRRDRITFLVVVLVIAGTIVIVEYLKFDPAGILDFTLLPLAIFLFFAWEVGRWRMRHKYPLPKPESSGE
jgi:hypothetical protein